MYPGEFARLRCAVRTRAELVSYRPKRPLALRDELRLRGMAGRCCTCRACPAIVATLAAMVAAPAEAGTARPEAAVILKLAS
jgi:hypothetical protein